MKRQRQQGFALLLTLFAILVLSTIAIDLSYNARVAASIAGSYRDRLKGYYLAKAGIDVALLRLEIDNLADKVFGKKDDFSELQWAMPFSYPAGLAFLAGQMQQAGGDGKVMEKVMQDNAVDGTFESEIKDEGGKININSLKLSTDSKMNGTYMVLLNLLYHKDLRDYFRDKRPQEFINNLIDWIDQDSDARDQGGGLEDYFYQSLPLPYHAKNGPFFTFSETRLVKGARPALLEALRPHLTIYPYSTNVFTGNNYARINVNTAGDLVLASLFDRNRVSNPEELAKKIVEYRGKQAFKKKEEFLDFLTKQMGLNLEEDVPKDVQAMLTVSSEVFQIISTAEINETISRIEAVVDREDGKIAYYYWKVD